MKLVLQPKERERLRQALQRAGDVRLYRRLQAAWLAGEGWSATRIAELTGASARSVKYWCARWRRGRRRHDPAEVLAEPPRLGAPAAFEELTSVRLLEELSQDPLQLGYAAANWTVPLLARHLQDQRQLGISPRTLRRRRHAAGLRWKRPRYVLAAPAEYLPQKKGR